MKTLRQILTTCSLMLGLGMVMNASAAGLNLPEIGVNPSKIKAEQVQTSLKKDAICTKCHDENESTPILSIYQTKHGVRGDSRTPNCQSCHGDSDKHVKGSPDPEAKTRPAPDVVFLKHTYSANDEKTRAGQCLTCHKGEKRTNWDGSKHQNGGVACNDCHKVHQPSDKLLAKKTQTEICYNCHKEQRADSHKISTHPIDAGKVVCSDCHNPHGSQGPKLLKKATVTETCFTCHAEKRGPFLWEHQPVTEDCANCHTPHGSNITPLLKDRPPFLCQQCHDGVHNSATPRGPNVVGVQGGAAAGFAATGTSFAPSTSNVGRACMNCHVMVHGSNSPAGAYLHR